VDDILPDGSHDIPLAPRWASERINSSVRQYNDARFKSFHRVAGDVAGPREPPTPPGGRRVLGHTLPFLREPLGTLERWGGTEEDLVQGSVAGRQFCLVSAPDVTKQVLVNDIEDYRKAEIVRENLGTLQGGSLVLLEGEEWRKRRRLIASGFDGERVRAVAPLTTRHATDAVEGWPTTIRADERMRSLSLSILAEALFGMERRGERTPIHEAADDILARMNPRSLSAFLPEWAPTPTNYRFRRAVRTLHDSIDAVVADAEDSGEADNLLAVMLAAGVDPGRIRDELIALLFAGYDSTATALAVTLGLIADNPDVQRRLRRELGETLDGERPTPDDLEELAFLDAVVRESLRLYPPQYALFREPIDAVTLGGYHVDPETTVVLSPWICGRDGDHWRAPKRFRPERWRSDHERPAFAYFPYGGGPRHCLGRGFAEQTIRLVVAVVCGRRRLRLQGELSVSAGPTLAPGSIELRAVDDSG
jgi:cytochrome P450